MYKILINKIKNISVNIEDIVSFSKDNKIVKVNFRKLKSITSDRRWSDLIDEFNLKKKGGNQVNMATKKGSKKGTKKGQ